MVGKFPRAIAVAIAVLLGGCFEVNSDAKFHDTGAATLTVEIGMTPELVALSQSPDFQKQGEGLGRFLKDCNKQLTTDELRPGITAGNMKTGQRDGMMTCTIKVEMTDPVLAMQGAKHDMAPPVSIVRIAGKEGYRVRGEIKSPKDNPSASSEPPPPMAVAMMSAMFQNRFFSIKLSGASIENSNGQVAPDGRSVTWKIPLTTLALSNGVPTIVEADVIYSEGFLKRWTRRLFG